MTDASDSHRARRDVPPDASPTLSNSTDNAAGVSRRDFMMRLAQAGAALSVGAPFVRGELSRWAPLEPTTRALAETSALRALPDLYSGLRWRMLGPFRGGRTDAVSGVPGRPNEFYMGAANGGVWKTVDAGRVWEPVFDGQPIASIGAIAVAPSAPDTVYVGTGENTLRDSMGFGNGVYKSTDAGRTWTHLGLEQTQHIGRIAVDPRNPNVVFVAAIGKLYAASPDRGVYRSRDGGRTWQKVLFKNDDVGAIEVVIDPTNSNVVYAGLWNARRPPWYTYSPSNGPGGGIFKSTDGGNTWKQLTNGLPATQNIGRTGIAVAPSNPRRVYAVVDALPADPNPPVPPPVGGGRGGGGGGGGGAAQGPQGEGGFFRSDDGGATWTRTSSDQAIWGRGWYFETVAVDPKNADVVYVPNVAVNRSKDAGMTWTVIRGSPGGDDYHQAWVSPDNPQTVIIASDQGTIITHEAQADDPTTMTWSSWFNQPTAQMYHISVDYRTPYWVTGAQQDSGAVAVRSRGKFGEISMRDWEPIGAGGESGYTAGDQRNPGIIFGGTGTRFDLAQNVSMPGTTAPPPGRGDWTQPLVFSKADPNALYYGSEILYKTTDNAHTWTTISGDLTRPDPGVPASLDATTAIHTDRNGRRGVIYTIAPSPLSAPLLWIGTDDGLIHLTPDDGKTWQNVTPPALTPWSRVTMIQASHVNRDTAYASVDRHQLQDFDPYIYRTRDMGKTWQRITTGIPAGHYVHVIHEDPKRQGLLFAGTELGAYVSFDDGDHWQPLQLNLPVTSVRDFEIHDNDLVVGTFGRGIWVIDDISPLRQINESVLASDAYLFKPSDYTYVQQGGDNGTPLQKDEPQALNPQNGAAIDFYLRNAASGPVTLEILDAAGTVVHAFGAGAEPQQAAAGGRGGRGGIPNVSPFWRPAPEPFSTAAGMHRAVWTPVAAGGGRGRGGGGGRGGGATPLLGTFTARLTVNGKTYTQQFTVSP